MEGSLGCPRIAIGQAEIGIDDADQRHQRKVVSLGDELRADDDVRFAARNGVEFQPQPLDAHEVRGEHDGARFWEMPLHLLGNALDAGAAGNQVIGRAAFGAGLRRLLRIAAMVALDLPAEPMFDEPA
ncbi:hypothetical protein D9M72_552100 [compost metagenome]